MAKAVTSIKEFVDLIGSNINAARRIKGITMQQLGDDIGMDRAAISKIENGKNITMETLVKIAAALEIQPSELMQGTLVVSDYDLEAYIVERKSFKNKNRRLSSNSDSKSWIITFNLELNSFRQNSINHHLDLHYSVFTQ